MKFLMMVKAIWIIITIFNLKLKKVDYQHLHKEIEVPLMIINFKESKGKNLIWIIKKILIHQI